MQRTIRLVLATAALGLLLGACNTAVQALQDADTPIESAALTWVPESLGTLPGASASSAKGVNPDGTVVVGFSRLSPSSTRAFRWTQAGGMQELGVLPGSTSSYATGTNADGTVVVGFSRSSSADRAFRWTQAGGMQELGTLPSGGDSQAYGVNADGTVVVGRSGSSSSFRAFRWTQAGGMQPLSTLPGSTSSEAWGVNADGTVVVGSSGSSSGDRAVRWTQQDAREAQTITFDAPPGKTLSDAPFAVAATASSNLPVALASDTPGVCTVAGTTVTLVSAGTCTLTASQAGNDDYAAATPVSRNFTVANAAQVLTFAEGTPTTAERGTSATLEVTSTTTTPIVLTSTTTGVCTVSGLEVSFIAVGTCTVTATQAATANYTASSASHGITVVRTLTDTALKGVSGSGTYGGSATLTATLETAGGDPLPGRTVAFTVAGADVGNAVTDGSGVATLTGVNLAGRDAGDYEVTASFAGDDDGALAASDGTGTLTVARATQAIAFTSTAPTNPTTGTSYTVSATATSGLDVTFSSTTESVCTVSGGTVSFNSAGACTVAADQAGDNNYEAAPQQTQSITVIPADATGPVIVPTVSGTLGANDWYTSDVAVSFAVTDPESEVTAQTGCEPVMLSTDTAELVLSCTATSAGGTSNASVTLKRDATPPTLAPTLSATQVRLNGSVTATPNASDALSGVLSQSCAPVVASSVGNGSVSCTAADNAGNVATASAAYSVTYGFEGFFSPVDNTVPNKAKAGQSIPLKWRLTDANGAPVTTLASVQVSVASLNCSFGSTPDAVEEYASGSSGLQNLGDGLYQFNWKTPKSYAGSCKTLQLDLGDGSTHTAQFQFTK